MRTIEWRGNGADERGIDKATGEVLVEIDPRYFRPTEVAALQGDATKARRALGWSHKTSFDTLIKEMVEADLVAILEEQERRNRHT